MKTMHSKRKPVPEGRADAGFAMILAILALMLLTFLGLSLTTATSTELQIANNYRWSIQALYNAEAGLDLAKRELADTDNGNTWLTLVPQARAVTIHPASNPQCDVPTVRCPPPDPTTRRVGPTGEANRSFENMECDGKWDQGFGWVLDPPTLGYPMQNISTFGGQTLAGTFTVWVRRPLKTETDGTQHDDDWSNGKKVIMTAEGTAPFQQVVSGNAFAVRNRAVRYVEGLISYGSFTGGCDENRRSQMGTGPLGANFDPCAIVDTGGVGAISEKAVE